MIILKELDNIKLILRKWKKNIKSRNKNLKIYGTLNSQ